MLITVLLLCCGCSKTEEKRFKLLKPDQTGIFFENRLTETNKVNINEYLYAYNGGGVATGDFNNDGLIDVYFTSNQESNKLYLNTGNLTFKDITETSGTAGLVGSNYWTAGVTLVDINQDGWLDIYCSQVTGLIDFEGHNQLFINNCDLTFTEEASVYNLDLKGYGQQAVFFDYDNDGDLDMYQANHSVHDRDVYVKTDKRKRRDTLAGDRLMRNDSGVFKDVTQEANLYTSSLGYSLSVSIADFNNDLYPDIHVSNDFHDNDYFYLNNGDGSFKDATSAVLGHTSTFSMGSDAADINNDGLIDLFTLDMRPDYEKIKKQSAGADSYEIDEYKRSFGYHYQYPRNMLQINQAASANDLFHFSEVGELAQVAATDWSWSVMLSDLDNNGSKDIFITNGILRRPNDLDYINYVYNDENSKNTSSLALAQLMPDGAVSNYAFRNNSGLGFTNVSEEWGLDYKGYSMGGAMADFDNDGDLDIVVNNLNSKAMLYENKTNKENQSLKIFLNGNAPNRNGIGAKVQLWSDGKTQILQNFPVRGWLSTSNTPLHFGLAQNIADSVQVTWPSGKIELKYDIATKECLSFEEKFAKLKAEESNTVHSIITSVKNNGLDFRHKEDKYNDFLEQRLLPHKLSTEGPAMVLGDINADGLEDIFIGGAAGQLSALYVQNRTEAVTFNLSPQEIFRIDQNKEDVDASFYDIDADGDLDLFVVSGVSENANQASVRGYLNDGKGNFTKLRLPKIAVALSTLTIHDFDRDGNPDLFVGGRVHKKGYGIVPSSYILFNSGKATFSDTNVFVINTLGMVRDSCWDETRNALIVVGEFMPITQLKFKERTFNKTEIPNSSGWWNTISIADLNYDGLNEFLLGNWGLNSVLRASAKLPLKLLVKDFDANGSTEPLLIYNRSEEDYIFTDLDALKAQVPAFRSFFPKYNSFAELNVPAFLKLVNSSPDEFQLTKILESGIFYQPDPQSHFKFQPFPKDFQVAPIQDISLVAKDGIAHTFAAVGNFYAVAPALGKQDAFGGKIFTVNFNENVYEPKYSYKSHQNLNLYKDMRKVQRLIGSKKTPYIITAASNDSINIFSLKIQ